MTTIRDDEMTGWFRVLPVHVREMILMAAEVGLDCFEGDDEAEAIADEAHAAIQRYRNLETAIYA